LAAQIKVRKIFIFLDVISIKTEGAFISRKLSAAVFIAWAIWFLTVLNGLKIYAG
jgi:hypothetical protein